MEDGGWNAAGGERKQGASMTRGVGPLNYATAMPRKGRKIFSWVLFILLAILLITLLQYKNSPSSPVSFSRFSTELTRSNVASVTVSGDDLVGRFSQPVNVNGTTVKLFRCALPTSMSSNWQFLQWLNSFGAEVQIENNPNLLLNILIPLIPWILIFLFIWFFVFRTLRARQNLAAPQYQEVIPIPPMSGPNNVEGT
jgi:ATP-dependent Zn protease